MIRLPRAHVTRLEELSERLTGVGFPFEAPSNPSLRELLAAHTRYLDFHDKFADKRFRYELSHVQPPDFLDFSEKTNWKGMSRALLKFNGGSVHDYATIADDSPRPSRASRARRAATSAGIS